MEILNVQEAAKLAKVSVLTIRNWYRGGKIRSMEYDGSGRCLIPKEEIEHILDMRKLDREDRKAQRKIARDIRVSINSETANKMLDRALDEFCKPTKRSKDNG